MVRHAALHPQMSSVHCPFDPKVSWVQSRPFFLASPWQASLLVLTRLTCLALQVLCPWPPFPTGDLRSSNVTRGDQLHLKHAKQGSKRLFSRPRPYTHILVAAELGRAPRNEDDEGRTHRAAQAPTGVHSGQSPLFSLKQPATNGGSIVILLPRRKQVRRR